MDTFLEALADETGPATATETDEAQEWARWVADVAQRTSRGDKTRAQPTKRAGRA